MSVDSIKDSRHAFAAPARPNTSVWQGRVVNGVAPTLSIAVALFEGTLSTYYFINQSDVWGSIHAVAGVAACCVASCFTKYYFQLAWRQEEKSFNQLIGEQGEIEQHLNQDLEKNQKNAELLGKQAADWQELGKKQKTQDDENNEKMLDVAQRQETVVEDLKKMADLKEKYDVSLAKTNKETQSIKGVSKEIERKAQLLQIELGRLVQIRESLETKIKGCGLNDLTIAKEISQLGELIIQLKEWVEKSGVEYNDVATERDARERTLEELGAKRELLERVVRDAEKVVEKFKEEKDDLVEVVTHVAELNNMPKRKREKKRILNNDSN